MVNSDWDRRGRPGPAEPAQGAKSPITVGFVLDVLRRWWKITVPVGLLLAAGAATLVYVTFVPEYEARALLWMDSQQPYLVKPERYGDRNFVDNQLGLIRSSLVLGPVISRPEIARLPELQTTDLFQTKVPPVERLAKLIDVSRAWGTEHYHVKCTTPNGKSSKAIANAVCESYLDLVDEYEAGRTAALVKLLDQERELSKREVDRLRENVRTMAVEQTGKDPFATHTDEEGRLVLPLAALESQITSLEVEQAVLKAQISAMEQYLEENPLEVTDEMVERTVAQAPVVLQQEGAIAAKGARLLDIKSKSPQREKAALYVKLESEISRDEQMLADLRDQLREQARNDLRSGGALQRAEQLAQLKARLTEFGVRKGALLVAYQEELKQVKQYTGATLDLEMRKAELARADLVMDKIAERAFFLRTEQRAPRRVMLIEPATVPPHPVEPLPFKMLVLASVGTFLLPIAPFFLWELKSRRFSAAEQLDEVGRLPVIGEIASFPSIGYGTGRKAARISRRLRPFEESIEGLRTYLVLSKPVEDMQVLAVTSACSQEGKTTVAAQLALSIARSTNQPTLLVDGDTRSPDIHQIFDIENESGLFEVLTGQCRLEEVVAKSWHERLDILPAGLLRGNPYEPFGNGALKSALGEARKLYRHIVIDTPPVLATSEAMVIAAAADASILCVMRDRTRRDQARKAGDRLTGAGANVIGCVFNGISLRQYSYYYGRYDYGKK